MEHFMSFLRNSSGKRTPNAIYRYCFIFTMAVLAQGQTAVTLAGAGYALPLVPLSSRTWAIGYLRRYGTEDYVARGDVRSPGQIASVANLARRHLSSARTNASRRWIYGPRANAGCSANGRMPGVAS